jgi:ATP-dependent helicase HrpA
LAMLERPYRQLVVSKSRLGALGEGLEQFGWLLEELRVSLFAQELKTPVPISAKRLAKLWQTLAR